MAHKICDVFGRVTEEEQHARKHVKFLTRLCYVHGFYGDEMNARFDHYDSTVTDETPISDLYAMLDDEQKADLRHSIENPRVRVHSTDKATGEPREWWIEENNDLLARLEAGVEVGPITETQIKRRAGDRAF